MTNFTRVIIFAFLVPGAFLNVLTAQLVSETPKFSLAIKAEKSEVVLGSDVAIRITITNISEETLTLSAGYHGNLPDGYQYEVRDEQGTLNARVGKRYHKLLNGETVQLPSRLSGSSRMGGLQPGKSIEDSATVSDVYQFNSPGKYTIQASRKLPGKPVVRSNIITITVVAAETPASAPQ
jgi:hypothetical protein